MTVPEEGNNAFSPLAEEFNRTATSFARGESYITLDALMAKYSILQKLKAETPADRMRLSESLLDCALSMLKRIANPTNRENLSAPVSSIQSILTRLSAAEDAPHVPARAVGQLADAALDLVRKSEKIPNYDYDWNDCQAHKTALVKLALSVAGTAETLRGKESTAGFAAAKTIAPPAKRPVLQAGNTGI
jgi:hypothetical protein